MELTGRTALRLALLFAFLLAVFYLATERLARPWIVQGPSMEPTLRAGDRVIVDLWTYRQREPRRGEVVLFRAEPPGSPSLVKRVVAPPPGRIRTDREIWVLGDNRSVSADSRVLGPVPRERLIGRVAYRYWPPSRTGCVR